MVETRLPDSVVASRVMVGGASRQVLPPGELVVTLTTILNRLGCCDDDVLTSRTD